MPEALLISRKPPAATALNFAELRQAGIAYLEKVVGGLWSDYNVHDPGITLLELLCYGITDITYRTTFPDADIFAPALEQSPPKPEDPPFTTARFALTNAPVTINDYRKLFLDRFEELRNVWLDPVTETLFVNTKTRVLSRKAGADTIPFDVRGLYNVRLLFHDNIKTARKKEVIEELTRFYYENRNLCEDLEDVGITPLQDILVCAEIQLLPDADIDETHAKVVFALQSFLSPLIPRYSLATLVDRGLSPDEIFDGPRLERGFILDDDLDAGHLTGVRSSDLIAVILGVPGVAAVTRFQLNYPPKHGKAPPPSEWELRVERGHHPRLADENARLDFFKGPLPFISDPARVGEHLKSLRAEASAASEVAGPFDRAIPAGTWRDLGDFTTLQEALPLNYGVGRRGFDSSAPPDRRAKARQLQAFLFIFDQLLANYLGQLVNLRALFSTNPNLQQSYFSNAVSDLPDLRELLNGVVGKPAVTSAEVEAEYRKLREDSTGVHDDWVERRFRIIDHLLARLGEVFTDHVLMHYSADGANMPKTTLEKKCLFLSELPLLSYNRLQAHDILDAEKTWDTVNVSGFEKRLARLLGFACSERRNLSDIVYKLHEEDTGSPSEVRFRIVDTKNGTTIFLGMRSHENKDDAFAEMRRAIQLGMSAVNYRFLKSQDNRIFLVIVDESGEIAKSNELWPTQAEAQAARDHFVALLARQYSEEGMFLIEHLLLRARPGAPQSWPLLPAPCLCGESPNACAATPNAWDPYSFRVHLIFPGYSACLVEPGFRRFVEEIVLRELPAHLEAKICFISREALADFEQKYRAWLDSLASGKPKATVLQALLDCLSQLHTIYPAGTLHDCTEDGDEASAIVLNQSRLGTLPPDQPPPSPP